MAKFDSASPVDKFQIDLLNIPLFRKSNHQQPENESARLVVGIRSQMLPDHYIKDQELIR